jgi:hypothetical protein
LSGSFQLQQAAVIVSGPLGVVHDAISFWRVKVAVGPGRLVRFQRIFDHQFMDVIALRAFKGPQVGMVGTRFDPGQHHAALTFRAGGRSMGSSDGSE